jgi:hypothetical protein
MNGRFSVGMGWVGGAAVEVSGLRAIVARTAAAVATVMVRRGRRDKLSSIGGLLSFGGNAQRCAARASPNTKPSPRPAPESAHSLDLRQVVVG